MLGSLVFKDWHRTPRSTSMLASITYKACSGAALNVPTSTCSGTSFFLKRIISLRIVQKNGKFAELRVLKASPNEVNYKVGLPNSWWTEQGHGWRILLEHEVSNLLVAFSTIESLVIPDFGVFASLETAFFRCEHTPAFIQLRIIQCQCKGLVRLRRCCYLIHQEDTASKHDEPPCFWPLLVFKCVEQTAKNYIYQETGCSGCGWGAPGWMWVSKSSETPRRVSSASSVLSNANTRRIQEFIWHFHQHFPCSLRQSLTHLLCDVGSISQIFKLCLNPVWNFVRGHLGEFLLQQFGLPWRLGKGDMMWLKVPEAEQNTHQHKAISIARHCGCNSRLQVKVQNFEAVNQKMPMLQLYVIDFEPWRQQWFHKQTLSVEIHKKKTNKPRLFIYIHLSLHLYLPTNL